MATTSLKIGFIGLGIMGAPMALNLVNAGHQLYVNTVGKMPESIASSSAKACASAEEVTRSADIIFTMVPDTPDVEAVLFGAGGIAQALKAGGGGARKIIVDMSSHLADRHQGLRDEDQCARRRLHRCAGLRGRSRCQGGIADHHVRRRRGRVRQDPSTARTDGQEHHAGRRQRRRADHQGRESDHRRAQYRCCRRSAAVRQQGRRRSGQGAPGADGRFRIEPHP
jgi:hypothetical protein